MSSKVTQLRPLTWKQKFGRWTRKLTKPHGIVDWILASLLVFACVAGVFALIFGIVCLGGLIFYLAWNLGVVGVASAAGASVSKISFWTAVGASLAIGIVKGILSSIGRPKVTVPETK